MLFGLCLLVHLLRLLVCCLLRPGQQALRVEVLLPVWKLSWALLVSILYSEIVL